MQAVEVHTEFEAAKASYIRASKFLDQALADLDDRYGAQHFAAILNKGGKVLNEEMMQMVERVGELRREREQARTLMMRLWLQSPSTLELPEGVQGR
jgi:hypothetical protein